MKLERIPVTITTDASGDYTVTTSKKYTGRLIGFHTRLGASPYDMTTCTLTIAGVAAAITNFVATTRTLYTKASTGATSFTPVRVQCVDNAGSAIAGEYESPYIVNEAIKVTAASGGNTKKMYLEILLEVQDSATHTN